MRFPSIRLTALGCVALMMSTGGAAGAVIGFGTVPETVLVGETVTIPARITYESGETASLFSYGIVLLGVSSWLNRVTILETEVPAGLNYNGVSGPGALRVSGTDFTGVKGTINLSGDPLVFYGGDTLVIFHLQFQEPGTYPLRLDFLNTLGPTEDIFVDGQGAVLDERIRFGNHSVTVLVPEPEGVGLLIPSFLLLGLRRHHRSVKL